MATPDQIGRARSNVAIPAALLITVTWAAVAISCIGQKRNADEMIADAGNISAVQIQQLNGQVAAHVLVAIAIGLAVTATAGFWLLVASSKAAVAAVELLDEVRARGDSTPLIPPPSTAIPAPWSAAPPTPVALDDSPPAPPLLGH